MELRLHKYTKIGIAIAALGVAAISSTGSARAWGCVAVSENGTYGYSYNFDDRDGATNRALNECAKRATTDQTCEITDCSEDN
jgi:predicted lipoprotein with Yx(FWY)xxD motif